MSGSRHRRVSPKERNITILAALLVAFTAVWLIRRRSNGRPPTTLGQIQSRWVGVHGLKIHTRISVDPVPGDRPPLVLVHGLGMSSRYMIPIAEHLAPHFRVYAPDLPGFGWSDRPGQILTIPELADALAAWMDAAGLGRAVLVGNSLGCEVLVELALRHRDRIERLVLQGPTPDPAASTALEQIASFFVTGLFERWSLGWIALSDYVRSGPWRFAQTFYGMIENRIEEQLSKVTVPVLVVWGTRDYIVPQDWAERVARLLPKGRLVVIPGAAHAINFSHPREFRDAVLPFLLGAEDPQ